MAPTSFSRFLPLFSAAEPARHASVPCPGPGGRGVASIGFAWPLALAAGLLVLAGCAGPSRTSATETGPARAAASERASKSDQKSYSDVITDEAESDDGLFRAHRVDDDLFFEIPDSLLGRDMLLISRIAQVPANLSPFLNGGSKVAEQVVRWERRDDEILLRKRSFQSVANETLAVALSVEVNNFEPIVASFDIESPSEDSAGVVIKVNDLFEDDVPAISGLSPSQRSRFKVRRLDGSRSFIDEVKSFPQNVNVRHTMTFEATEPPSRSGQASRIRVAVRLSRATSSGTTTTCVRTGIG